MDVGEELKALGRHIRQDAALYRHIAGDNRTPILAKVLIGAVVTFAIGPIDALSELTMMPAMLVLAMKMVPSSVIAEASMQSAVRIEAGQNQQQERQLGEGAILSSFKQSRKNTEEQGTSTGRRRSTG